MSLRKNRFFHLIVLLTIFLSSCYQNPKKEPISEMLVVVPAKEKSKPVPLTSEFKKYWYSGVAELNSYELKKARYGEIRDGEAVLIYVTEPFNTEAQVKSDKGGDGTTSVMKLNRVSKFFTGVYPYSIMSSIFYPVQNNQHALKVTTSVQEWCGHVYAQINNRETFEIKSHSYFEGEADQSISLSKNILEDELWIKLRFSPDTMPEGEYDVIPSLEYLRLKHQPVKAYKAELYLSEDGPERTYTLTYPNLNRTLQIHFHGIFPHKILGWKESYPGGFSPESPLITSEATLKNTLKTPYWRKNSNADISLRDSLGLTLQ